MLFEDLLLDESNFEKNEKIESMLKYGEANDACNILVTIAIPTYNRAKLLSYALDSALNQKHIDFNYEIIVVDNNSDSHSETDKLMTKYNKLNVKYYKNKSNLGMFGNWNRCIELANGKWVAFLHDDDVLSSDYLFKIKKMLDSKKDIGCIMSKFKYIDGKGEEISRYNSTDNKKYKKKLKSKFNNKLMRIRPIDIYLWNYNPYGAPTCGSIFNRDYVIRCGGFDERLYPSADWFFLVKFNCKYKVYKSLDFLGYYRVFDNTSLSVKVIKEFVNDAAVLRSFLCNKSFVSKFMNFIFKYEDHAERVLEAVRNDKSNQLSIDSFNDIINFKDRVKIRKIYRYLFKLYWRIKAAFGYFM